MLVLACGSDPPTPQDPTPLPVCGDGILADDVAGAWGGDGCTPPARLLDASGTPITDLRPGLAPGCAWLPDQSDTDGDGEGDVCDDG